MRHRSHGSCLCDRCCARAREGSPQYNQQYGLFGFGWPGNGLGRLGGGQSPVLLQFSNGRFHEPVKR